MGAMVENFLGLGAAGAGRRPRRAPRKALARAYLGSALPEDERDEIEAAMTILLDDPAVEVRLVLADALARQREGAGAYHHGACRRRRADRARWWRSARRSSSTASSSTWSPCAARRCRSRSPAGRSCRAPFPRRSARSGPRRPAARSSQIRGARVPRFSLDRIVARHGDCPELRLALLERSDLPLEVREMLLGKLAEALRELIVAHGWTTPERAATVTRDAHECATIAAAFEAPADNMPALVAPAHRGRGADARLPDPRRRRRADAALRDGAFRAREGAARARLGADRLGAPVQPPRASAERAKLPQKTFPVFAAAIDVIRKGDAVAGRERATIAAPPL